MPDRHRVAFYLDQPFHDAILRPVHALLVDEVETLYSADPAAIIGFAPHVLVQASFADLARFRSALPRTVIGSVDHGLTPKGVPRRIGRLREERAKRLDFMCVGDDNMAAAYRQAGIQPKEFWYTGYPQLDPLFRRDPPPALALDPAQRTVLFAPTWNAGLSAAPVLGDRLAELIRGDGPPYNIIIKPHPHVPLRRGQWMNWWRRLAERDERVHLVSDAAADVTPYLLAADLLVSDVSSVTFLFLALDRPIVLVTNPRHPFDPAYDPDDLNWRWRDLATEVTDPDRQLAAAVSAALANPGERSEIRQRYAAQLFGPRRDGRNAQRVAERILATLERLADVEPYAAGPPATRVGLRAILSGRRPRLVRSTFYLRHFKGLAEDIRLALRGLRFRLARRVAR
ncbi:MAG: CDP-glycerol glycerophosphotransferase family protein [Chloroflexota bacterium]|nr:CDP-glycerol glycerophosphotransferase family protein [Chloroflexota bacterium]